MRPSRAIGLLLASLVAAAVPAARAGDAEDSKAFVRKVYAAYADFEAGKAGRANAVVFDRSLGALIDDDTRLTPDGEAGALDWDPVCQCQDFSHLRATVTISDATATRATARVRFHDTRTAGDSTHTATFDLVKESQGWRIHDIHSKDFENPAHSLRAFLEAAVAEKRKSATPSQ